MALSMADKLRQAAAARMARTSGTTSALLDDMDARSAKASQQSPSHKRDAAPLALLRSEEPAPYGADRAGQPSTTTEQDNRTGQVSRTTEQDNRAEQPSNRAGQPGTLAGQPSRATGQDNRTGQPGTITGQDNRAGQVGRTIKQDNRAGQPGRTTEQGDVLSLLLPAAAPARTPAQKSLLAYFERYGTHVSNYDRIIAETGLPLATVRRTLDKFLALGMLSKSTWCQGSARGLRFTFHGATGQDNRAGQPSTVTGQDNQAPQSSRTTEQDNRAEQRGTSLMKIDRKNLSISLKTLETSWPTLARAGFGLDQIEQIHASLAQLGKTADRIVQGLDHAEWELAEGKMLDKQGQPVADPCAWVYRSLASQGYYRRPAGYVSAEEQAERDAAEEGRALAKSREAARQERFRAWLQGLTAEEREKALAGKIGPEEAWLKKEWMKRGEPA